MAISLEEAIDALSLNTFRVPDEVERIISSIKCVQLIPNLILWEGQTIYRARIINDMSEIVDSKSLSYVPSALNNTYKRASTPKNTMFYGVSSENNKSSIYGCYAETCGCFRKPVQEPTLYNIVISQWQTTRDLKLIEIIDPCGNNKSEAFINYNEYNELANLLSGQKQTDLTSLMKFLNHEFTKIVDDNDDRGYWVSAIMSERLLKTHSSDGIIYESVQTRNTIENDIQCVAILPSIVDEHMVFKKAELHKIEIKNYNKDISILSSFQIL